MNADHAGWMWWLRGGFADGWIATRAALGLWKVSSLDLRLFLPRGQPEETKRVIVKSGTDQIAEFVLERRKTREISISVPGNLRDGVLYLEASHAETLQEGSSEIRALGFICQKYRINNAEWQDHKSARLAPDHAASGDARPPYSLEEYQAVSRAMDYGFYRSHFPGQPPGNDELIHHFLTVGWRQGLDPCSWFSLSRYISESPSSLSAAGNPFVHFLLHDRTPAALRLLHPEGGDPSPAERDAAAAQVIRDHMDLPFYRLQQASDRLADGDLVRHYIETGWKEGLDPSPHFSTSYYLEANPDVLTAGLNPFYHYIATGRSEGRYPKHPAGDRIVRLRHAETLEKMTERRRQAHGAKENASDSAIAGELLKGADRLLIAFSHDDYTRNSGGVQLCLQLEERLARERQLQYLVAFPAVPLPRLADPGDGTEVLVNLVLNGKHLGCCSMPTLIRALANARPRFRDVSVAVHHFLGHQPERIADLARSLGKTCAVWVHDYFTLCPSYTLQRNSISYCGAPPPQSTECWLCLFGSERPSHLRRLEKFFAAVEVHVISPSQLALDLWRAKSPFEARSSAVIPHMSLRWEPREEPLERVQGGPVRVGFLGTKAPHKGWPVFEQLAREFSSAGGYEFTSFNLQKPKARGIGHVPVHVTADDRNAMIRAVADAKIDIVINWAEWPETFSFSTYEAIAGGAFVVTNTQSGNVARAVEALESGLVLDGEAELVLAFRDGRVGQLATLARERRSRNRCVTALSAMSLSILSGGVT